MTSLFLERLHSSDRPVIVFDGAMGTILQVQNLTAEDFGGAEYEGCNEYLVMTKPEAVATVHRDFLAAGADVIETDTFGGTSIVLNEYNLGHLAYELSKKATELAKSVAAEFSTPEKPRFVAGSIGPTTKLPTLLHIDFDTMKQSFIEQIEGLYDGGADLLIVETCQDVLQIKVALNAIAEFFDKKAAEGKPRIPVMVSVTMETTGTMLVGSDISAVVTILEPYPIDILGLNCATGPDLMKEHMQYLSAHSPFVVSCVPNAGLPENVGGQAFYRLTPDDLKGYLQHFVEDLGVQIIGGCCGTRPSHIKALADAAKTLKPKLREPLVVPSAASIYSSQPYIQDNSFLIVGERLNASGSKKTRDLLNAEDWDGLVGVARSQVKITSPATL
jgi:5-methyltetrahydrofolate--homocysteine methyltransferase